MSRLGLLAALGALGALASVNIAQAFPIAAPGAEGLSVLVGSTSNIIATYEGNSASYSNDLYLLLDSLGNPGDDGDLSNDLFIFNNHSSSVGSTVDLGSFNVGDELIFRLHVNNTGNDFFTGIASRNPDNSAHARVQEEWMTDTALVSFEDLFNGPFVFNDLSFSFTNTVTTPPPPTPGVPVVGPLSLISLGFLPLWNSVRRKKT